MMKDRIYWLDIAKGIAIILMVLGHTSIPGLASHFIYAFHMPLFFIASGISTDYRKRSVRDFVFRKSYTLLLPFFNYSIIVLSLMSVLGGAGLQHWLCKGWEGYALWFIPVLFMANGIARLVYMTKKAYIRYIMVIITVVIGCTLSYSKLTLPWTMSTMPYATFLILVGSEMKRLRGIIEKSHWWLILITLAATAFVSCFWHLNMAWNNITPVVPITIGALSGTIMLFMLSAKVEKNLKWCSNVLQAVGKETYIILAFSQITIMLMNEYLSINPLLKYIILVLVLFTLKYAKDLVNKTLGIKLL